jgi:hypothetical protein
VVDTTVAAQTLGIGVAELRRRIGNSGGHFTGIDGTLWVCRAWLSQHREQS